MVWIMKNLKKWAYKKWRETQSSNSTIMSMKKSKWRKNRPKAVCWECAVAARKRCLDILIAAWPRFKKAYWTTLRKSSITSIKLLSSVMKMSANRTYFLGSAVISLSRSRRLHTASNSSVLLCRCRAPINEWRYRSGIPPVRNSSCRSQPSTIGMQ